MDASEASRIREQMAKVRNKQPQRVADLSIQADRLTDWREHVKAAPITALAVSIAAGFGVASTLLQSKRSKAPAPAPTPAARASVPAKAGIAATVGSFILPYATRWAKQYVTNMVSAAMENRRHDKQPHALQTSEWRLPN